MPTVCPNHFSLQHKSGRLRRWRTSLLIGVIGALVFSSSGQITHATPIPSVTQKPIWGIEGDCIVTASGSKVLILEGITTQCFVEVHMKPAKPVRKFILQGYRPAYGIWVDLDHSLTDTTGWAG